MSNVLLALDAPRGLIHPHGSTTRLQWMQFGPYADLHKAHALGYTEGLQRNRAETDRAQIGTDYTSSISSLESTFTIVAVTLNFFHQQPKSYPYDYQ